MNENLIQKAINKDEDAIRQIYNETYKKAYIVAYSFMKDDNLIQDVLQIAYISVFRNLDKLNSPVALQAWINKIVSNTCKNELRKERNFLLVILKMMRIKK